jgi:hypothetical protein
VPGLFFLLAAKIKIRQDTFECLVPSLPRCGAAKLVGYKIRCGSARRQRRTGAVFAPGRSPSTETNRP